MSKKGRNRRRQRNKQRLESQGTSKYIVSKPSSVVIHQNKQASSGAIQQIALEIFGHKHRWTVADNDKEISNNS